MSKKMQNQAKGKATAKTQRSKKAIPEVALPRETIWDKHARLIEQGAIKTVKELSLQLKKWQGDQSGIEGISRTDATEMLIDIGLGVLPFGLMFREEVLRRFKDSPKKITYKNILSTLKEISKTEKVDKRLATYLTEAIKQGESGKVKDPFKEDTPLSDHPATASVFRTTIIDAVSKALKFNEVEIAKLKQRYRSRDQFMKSGSKEIQATTGTPLLAINRMKAVLCFTKALDISITLANAFAEELSSIEDFLKLASRDLRDIIEKSGIKVPDEEKTDAHLNKVIASAKKVVPDLAYYNDVIPSLKLPKGAESFLKSQKVQSFGDLRKNGLLAEVIKKGEIRSERTISNLKAHTRLELISKNVGLNTTLITDNIRSAYQISKLALKDFQEKYKAQAGQEELTRIHQLASSITAKNLPIAAWANLASKNHHLDKVIGKPKEQEKLKLIINSLAPSPANPHSDDDVCECRHCASVLSPAAYLLALLQFIEDNLVKDPQLLFDRMCRPKFLSGTVDCDLVNNEVSQITIAIGALVQYIRNKFRLANEGEVYNKLSSSKNPPPFFHEGTRFREYLTALGTSLYEIHDVFANPEVRAFKSEQLAEKLGISLAELQDLQSKLDLNKTEEVLGVKAGDIATALTNGDPNEKLRALASFLGLTREDLEIFLDIPIIKTTAPGGIADIKLDPEFDFLRRITGLTRILGITAEDMARVLEVKYQKLKQREIGELYKLNLISNYLSLTWTQLTTLVKNQTDDELITLLGLARQEELDNLKGSKNPSIDLLAKVFTVSIEDIGTVLSFINIATDAINTPELNKLYRLSRLAQALRVEVGELLHLLEAIGRNDINSFDYLAEIMKLVQGAKILNISLEEMSLLRRPLERPKLDERLGKTAQELDELIAAVGNVLTTDDERKAKLSDALGISQEDLVLLLSMHIKDAGTDTELKAPNTITNIVPRLELLHRPLRLCQTLGVNLEELKLVIDSLKININNTTYAQIFQAHKMVTIVRLLGVKLPGLSGLIGQIPGDQAQLKNELEANLGFAAGEWDNVYPAAPDDQSRLLSGKLGVALDDLKKLVTSQGADLTILLDVEKIRRIVQLAHQLGMSPVIFNSLLQNLIIDITEIDSYLRVCALLIAPNNLNDLLVVTGLNKVKNIDTCSQIYWLYTINGLANSLGISINELSKLNIWEHQVTSVDVVDLLAILKAQYDEAQLKKELKKPDERIWQKTRDALGTYAVAISDPAQIPDKSALSDELLIDLEVSPCLMTSEVQQAIESVQTYVMRVRTGLEGVGPAVDEEQWRWLQRYVLWEAAMKVFLNVEDFIMPQLRDDKTPFFQDLEDELSQGEVTQTLAGKAISGYIDKLHSISALRVSGAVYHQEAKTLHIFARSQINGKETYYRTLKDQRIWSPWVKLEAEINADRVYPLVAYHRVYIFWIETEEEKNGDQTKYKHKLSYCYTMEKGKWSKSRKHDLPLENVASPILEVSHNDNGHLIIKAAKFDFYHPNPIGITYLLACNDSLEITEIALLDFFHQSWIHSSSTPIYLCIVSNSAAGLGISDSLRFPAIATLSEANGINVIYGDSAGKLVFLSTEDISRDSYLSIDLTVLNRVDPAFKVDVAVEIGSNIYFFCSDQYRCLLIVAHLSYDRCGTKQVNFSISQLNYGKYCKLTDRLFQEGLEELYDPYFQTVPGLEPDFKYTYGPKEPEVVGLPPSQLEFQGPNKIYNVELFFQIPYLIAEGLSQNRKFELASKWYHYIGNPYSEGKQVGWRFKPFTNGYIQQLADYLDDPEDAAVWRADPFSPHALARVRPGAYQKAVILSYIDNLLEWGDQEFTRDTRDSINRARGLYLLAEKLLMLKDIEPEKACDRLLLGLRVAIRAAVGKAQAAKLINELAGLEGLPPEKIGELHRQILVIAEANNNEVVKAQNISDLLVRMKGELQSLPGSTFSENGARAEESTGDLLEKTEDRFLPETWVDPVTSSLPEQEHAAIRFLASSMVGCIPENPVFQTYRHHIDSNLRKIRSGRNIAGVPRILPTYEASIDPMSVVKAVASGAGLEALNFANAAGIGPYRFAYLIERAKTLASLVVQAGNALLLAIEKKESEELAYIRAQQELKLAKANVHLRKLGVAEAEDGLELAKRQTNRAVFQFDNFDSWIRAGENDYEKAALDHLENSKTFLLAAAGLQSLAVVAALIPTTAASPTGGYLAFGGLNISQSLSAAASASSSWAQWFSAQSSIASMRASYARREEDWTFQRGLAEKDKAISEQNEQIAQDRIAIAQMEQQIAEMNAEFADQMLEFLKEKFTNKELYTWMVKTLSKVLYGFYNLAYTTARMAQATLEFERNETLDFISYGYWDSEKKGLLSGEQLLVDINRMDDHYVKNNARKLEVTKHISLAYLAPEALIALKSKGKTIFPTPMPWFDRDFPGHYQRIIKSVKVSVLALIGPATGINATLATVSLSRVVLDPETPTPVSVPRVQSVALSAPANATGLFELSYRDERYLPFEGCGVDVTWELEMPKASNRFDFNTMVDVIFSVDYTALADSEYKKQVINELGTATSGMLPLSIRNAFPDTWYHFHNPIWLAPPPGGADAYGDGKTPIPYSLKFVITRAMFPPNEERHSTDRVALRFSLTDPSIRIPLKLVRFTSENKQTYERNNLRTGEGGYIALESGIRGLSPFGTWEIYLDRDRAPEVLWAKQDGSPITEKITDPNKPRYVLDTEKLGDVILAITYKAEVEWPPES